ncbi:MAG: sigma E protease regulator RseP [Aeromonadaceae bacterium]
MIDILWNLLSFLVSLAILIAVHEWGHFWVARRCGVRVERFSLGFGKVLFSRTDRLGTEYSLSLIPLGGYVKMLDERVEEVPEALRSQAFNNKSVWQRFAIVAAGPIANFVFALFAFWLMFMLGVSTIKPVIGEVVPHSAAAQAGLQPGMEIVQVGDELTADWEAVAYALVSHLGDETIALTVVDDRGIRVEKPLSLQGWQLDGKEEQAPFVALGIEPLGPQVTLEVGQLVAGGRAEQVGLQVGDQLSKVNGQPLTDWQQFVTVIQNSPDVPVTIEVRRANGEQRFTVTPAAREVQGRKVGLVGLAPKVLPLDDKYRVELHYGPVEALWVGAQRTLSTMSLTLEMLKKLITGVVSLDNLSGPISIAKGAGSTASFGLVYFLGFLALVSVNLGIINLFPLPVLDGGHLLFFVIEAIKGSPVSEKVQEYAFKFGAAVLVCLMGIALFNDFVRL